MQYQLCFQSVPENIAWGSISADQACEVSMMTKVNILVAQICCKLKKDKLNCKLLDIQNIYIYTYNVYIIQIIYVLYIYLYYTYIYIYNVYIYIYMYVYPIYNAYVIYHHFILLPFNSLDLRIDKGDDGFSTLCHSYGFGC